MRCNRSAMVLGICAGMVLACGSAQAQEGTAQPSFLEHYVPVARDIKPNAPGYSLPLDVGLISNWDEVNGKLDLQAVEPLIRDNGFAVITRDFGFRDPNREDMVKPYEYLSSRDVPLFVSVDTWLHLYHIQFDETLREIEEKEFIGDMTALTEVLQSDMVNTLLTSKFSDPDFREAVRRNLAYVSVAYRLLVPDSNIPPMVETEVTRELDKIAAHIGFAESEIFIYKEDYSQYVPRGHYTRSEALKRYFKAMMWYGRMGFLLKGSNDWGPEGEALISVQDARIQTIQAVKLSAALRDAQVGEQTGLDVWDRLYTVTAFYVGLADDLTPYDYLWALDRALNLWNNPDDDFILAVKAELAALPSPRIYGGTGLIVVPDPVTDDSLNELLDKTKGLRFMGQRFVPDSYMFQNLIFPPVEEAFVMSGPDVPFTLGYFEDPIPFRCYVRGLDVMAVLGSHTALKTLIDDGDTDYFNFWLRFGQLKSEFDDVSVVDWHVNLYWGWLYALKALLPELPEGYPNFMRTDPWQRHQLHSALASWSQLRHDTILYAKQSNTSGAGGRPREVPPGYIEPQAEFLTRLLELNRMTQAGLLDLNVLSPEADQRLSALDELLVTALDITRKQLTNQSLSEEDKGFIKGLPDRLDRAVVGVDGAGLKTTMVADVHTHGIKKTVVEEATGKVDLIVVACPAADGSVFLAAGPVLSYYEFKHPMSDRLTDEAWRDMLDSDSTPERPAWYRRLMP
ncbi:MAG: DUF3160 domain-containing protein [Planctomycetes bacterium]|nr:DUF3160 domain-containing protein [Planctomycetota bacterium]